MFQRGRKIRLMDHSEKRRQFVKSNYQRRLEKGTVEKNQEKKNLSLVARQFQKGEGRRGLFSRKRGAKERGG